MGLGDFEPLCTQSPLPLCYLLGPPTTLTSAHNPLLPPSCSARSIELANTIIFQAATDFAHMAALAMTAIMIFHIRSKFTAVGRKEILTFFYIYVVLTAVSLVLDAGVLAAGKDGAFLWFVAVQNGLVSALCVSLLVNGFVGFQLYEDGTKLSVWLLRLTSALFFAITFLVSLLTFKSWGGLSPTSTTGLFIVLYVLNAIFLFVYLVMQLILVINTLQDRWPLWDLAAAVFFFVIGQVVMYSFGKRICEAVNHYLDGLFFATICNLLAVMMVYKYWDSITKEDLEFSVGAKSNNYAYQFAQQSDIYKDPSLLGTEPESMSPEHRFGMPDNYTANRASFYADTGRDSFYGDSTSIYDRPTSHGTMMTTHERARSRGRLESGYEAPGRPMLEGRKTSSGYADGLGLPTRRGDERKSFQSQVMLYEDYDAMRR